MIRDKIIRTIEAAAPDLKLLNDFYIIGASAIILHRIDIGETYDIDILTSSEDADKIKQVWNDKIKTSPDMKDSNLFHSNFAQFQFPEMEIEILGDLLVYINDEWVNLKVNDFITITISGLSVKIPTIEELIRILNTFNREKDHKRIDIINQSFQ